MEDERKWDENQRATSITGPCAGGGGLNKWSVIGHNLSSELNRLAPQGVSAKHFSDTNLIRSPPPGDVTSHLQHPPTSTPHGEETGSNAIAASH